MGREVCPPFVCPPFSGDSGFSFSRGRLVCPPFYCPPFSGNSGFSFSRGNRACPPYWRFSGFLRGCEFSSPFSRLSSFRPGFTCRAGATGSASARARPGHLRQDVMAEQFVIPPFPCFHATPRHNDSCAVYYSRRGSPSYPGFCRARICTGGAGRLWERRVFSRGPRSTPGLHCVENLRDVGFWYGIDFA